jgi:hypothetical protein
MQYLKTTKIIGGTAHVDAIRKLFGLVYFGGTPDLGVELEITLVVPNMGYVGLPLGDGKPTITREPLFVVVPNRTIDAIWPPLGADVEVRFGTASETGSCRPICAAVGIRRRRATMYLCLDPAGKQIMPSSNMGV